MTRRHKDVIIVTKIVLSQRHSIPHKDRVVTKTECSSQRWNYDKDIVLLTNMELSQRHSILLTKMELSQRRNSRHKDGVPRHQCQKDSNIQLGNHWVITNVTTRG